MVATFCSLVLCPRCSPRACATSAGSRSLLADARVLEYLVVDVVAGNERDPRAAEPQPVDRDRHVEEPFQPRTIGPHRSADLGSVTRSPSTRIFRPWRGT